MARSGIRITGLDRWAGWLRTLPTERIDRYKDRVLRSAGLRTLEYLQDLTPVRTNKLAGSFSVGAEGNVYDLSINRRESYVWVGTNVDYSVHVNDGYTQKAGRFVPGSWTSSGFHYDPSASGGMVLTGKTIAGAHMFEKSMQYMEEDLEKIMEFELRRLWAEVDGG